MTVTLAQTRVRPDDSNYGVETIGINYPSGKVLVRVRFQNGDLQDVTYEGARLIALRNAVAQFSGLRLAIETYLAATEPGLAGEAS